MTQNKVIKNKAGVNNQLKLNNGWLIEKTDYGYVLSPKMLNIFIHGDTIAFNTGNKENAWLHIYQDNVYIASLWIDNAVEIEFINELIRGE